MLGYNKSSKFLLGHNFNLLSRRDIIY